MCLSLWNFANISCASLHESLQLLGFGNHRDCPLGHAPTKGHHEVQHGLLLGIVVRDRVAILELLVVEDQALLLFRDALLVLDDGFEGGDGGVGLHNDSDGLACGDRHEDLHALGVVVLVAGVLVAGVLVVVVVALGVVVALVARVVLALVADVHVLALDVALALDLDVALLALTLALEEAKRCHSRCMLLIC